MLKKKSKLLNSLNHSLQLIPREEGKKVGASKIAKTSNSFGSMIPMPQAIACVVLSHLGPADYQVLCLVSLNPFQMYLVMS